MSYTKDFLEETSEKMGYQGRITKKVMEEARDKYGKEESSPELLIDEKNRVLSTKFFSAGKAIFTVYNSSGKHYTFKINHKKADPTKDEWQDKMPFYIYILTGQDNENSYTYMGVYNSKKNTVYTTPASKYNKDSDPIKVVNWGMRMVKEGDWNNPNVRGYGVKSKGRCARCGRPLTTPESIKIGIGPDCLKNMAY